MPVETKRPEIAFFINAGQSNPPEQFAEELASHSLETKRIPDPYYFTFTQTNELFSPTAHRRIKDTVEDQTGPLGKPEYQAVLSIEQWAAKSNEGAVVWVSPPYPGIYPTSKIIISEIEHENGTKRLFNRAIVLDFDEKECFEFAQNLAQFSQNRPLLSHLDQIRATPLILNTRISWMRILGELIDDPVLWQSIRNGDDQRAKREAVRQAAIVQKSFFPPGKSIDPVDAGAAIMQMLGSKSGSCPVVFKSSAFKVFSESSLLIGGSGRLAESDQYGSLEFECPRCKQTNKRPNGQLIPNCQYCSADVRC